MSGIGKAIVKRSEDLSKIADAGVELSGMSGDSGIVSMNSIDETPQNKRVQSQDYPNRFNAETIFQIVPSANHRRTMRQISSNQSQTHQSTSTRQSTFKSVSSKTNVITVLTTHFDTNNNDSQNNGNHNKNSGKQSRSSSNIMKQQMNEFEVELSGKQTIIYQILAKYDKLEYIEYFHITQVEKIAFVLALLNALYLIFDWTLNQEYIHSYVLTVFRLIFMFVCIIVFIITTVNYFVFIKALKTFVVWYKVFNSFMGIMAAMIFFDWEATRDIYKVPGQNGYYHKLDAFVVRGVFQSITFALFILLVSVMDGVPTNNVILRRTPIVLFIMYTTYLFFNVYFGINEVCCVCMCKQVVHCVLCFCFLNVLQLLCVKI